MTESLDTGALGTWVLAKWDSVHFGGNVFIEM